MNTGLDVISLTLSIAALGYTFLKDLWEKPKLYVHAYIADCYFPGRGDQPQVFNVTITNVGGKPIVVNGHEFRRVDGKKSAFPDVMDQFSHKKLDPYGSFSVTMSNPILQTLIRDADQLESFAVYDTKRKRWPLKQKTFKEIKNSLKEKQGEQK
jgi:hypothetical protein